MLFPLREQCAHIKSSTSCINWDAQRPPRVLGHNVAVENMSPGENFIAENMAVLVSYTHMAGG